MICPAIVQCCCSIPVKLLIHSVDFAFSRPCSIANPVTVSACKLQPFKASSPFHLKSDIGINYRRSPATLLCTSVS